MADKKAGENFMQHDGVEFGYWDKRKTRFNEALEKGFDGKGESRKKARPKKPRKGGNDA